MGHPRGLAIATEWTVDFVVSAEPLGIIRRLRFGDREVFRAVTGAAQSTDRELIGYVPSGDAAAVAVWRRYCEGSAERHERASTTHGSRASTTHGSRASTTHGSWD